VRVKLVKYLIFFYVFETIHILKKTVFVLSRNFVR